jgi:protein-L-isoaspartate(D-aspartate) O-methyltransferase
MRTRGLRDRLVDTLLSIGSVRPGPVADALRAVPRHVFLPGVDPETAYQDEAIPTRWSADGRPTSSSSQPAIVAAMLEQLAVRPGHRVLEIGSGTGWNAALLAHLVGPAGAVTTVDIEPEVAEQAAHNLAAAGVDRVRVVTADGAAGWAAEAPYDRIILTAAARDLAPAWWQQLGGDGRLVLPLSLRGSQRSVAFERPPAQPAEPATDRTPAPTPDRTEGPGAEPATDRTRAPAPDRAGGPGASGAGDELVSVSIVDCGFMPLQGELAGVDPLRPLGRPGLFLQLDDPRPVDTTALLAALDAGARVATPVAVSRREALTGLRVWLALQEPGAGDLLALREERQRPMPVLVADDGLAALVPVRGGRSTEVRGYGPGADTVADRLLGHVRTWIAAGRPGSAGLRIRAYPAGTELAGPVIDRPHTRFVVEWG